MTFHDESVEGSGHSAEVPSRAPMKSTDGELVGARYRIQRTLGRGGMGVVYAALDTTTGQELALKRLRVGKPLTDARELLLFEREFLTLVHASHPAVVSVYDYGVDELGPYYTMELLDGGDLQALSPLPYREACSALRDVLGALALLHSRRMVYRDLSPRNVRCASDGSTKLIDFGAMSPMGPSREWVGTLPFCAPEALYSQPLDARTDLYAFGATLYYALVKRHAYPARDAAQLYELWESPPPRPSELQPDVPEALDRLVMELIHPDAAQRPASAAEVIQRLTAIADLPPEERPATSQAYLSTPALVARDAAISLIQKLIERSALRRGASVLIQGPPGSGRSRLLESCVLHAKIAGFVVLQADPSDALEGRYAVARSLCRQLLAALPDACRTTGAAHAYALREVLPELAETFASVDDHTEQDERQVRAALRRWFREVSRTKPLLIAIDDVHLLDEESVSLLALLSGEVSEHALLLAFTLESSSNLSPAMRGRCKLLARTSLCITADELDAQQTRTLLGSVFGDVPNLEVVAHSVHALAHGNPRDIMQLAQYLVDEGTARYASGEWSLPARMNQDALPSSTTQALRARIAALGVDARQIALAMAYEPRLRFDFAECALLTEHGQLARLVPALEELVAAGIVVSMGTHYGVVGSSVRALPTDSVAVNESIAVHRRLAAVFEGRGDAFRVAQHLLEGGEQERGLDVLVQYAQAAERQNESDPADYLRLMQSPPEGWLKSYDLALRVAAERGRPASDIYHIRVRLSVVVSISLAGAEATEHVAALLDQLYRDSGLDLYAALDPKLDPGTRLARMFQEATQRYQALPEHARVVDPGTAIRQLAKVMLEAVGLIVLSNDYAFWKRLPSLAPLTRISPALEVVERLVQGLGARMVGRTEHALQIYTALLQRLAEPDGAGLGAAHLLHTRLRVTGSVGIQEAALGLRSCLERANELDPHSMYEINAKSLRALHHLWQGEAAEAERLRREVELLRIESRERQAFDNQHLMAEVAAHALAEDLTQMKRAVDAIKPFASAYPGWVPVLHYARGEHQRIRGDHATALAELDLALGSMPEGAHPLWAHTCGGRVRVLLELGRPGEARTFAEAALGTADENALGYVRNYVRMPLSLALSELGEPAAAVELAQAVIDSFEALGTTGLNLAAAYETRARVAAAAGDAPAVERFSKLAAGQLGSGSKRWLLAGSKRAARRPGSSALEDRTDSVSQRTQFSSMLQACNSSGERASCGIETLARQSGASGGVLYINDENGLVCASRMGDFTPDANFEVLLRSYFEKEANDREVTATGADPA
ncbi:MAG TPA: protein kinase, partial [Polyangiaceae bacterium]|nr:protein kinase [Polyangiaceae bacterium]